MESEFKFTYNGTQYVLPLKQGTAEWAILDAGIYINRPDLFNGIIYFPHSNCAYLEPQGQSVQMTGNCVLSSSGFPIDSVAVYIYQSGSVNLSYTNCVNKTEYDPYSGQTVTYQVCDVNGTFELTLRNKENKTISITNWEVKEYNLRR